MRVLKTRVLQTDSTAVGYARVSTGKQDLSLEAQTEKIQAMAVVQGLRLLEVITDAESGKDIDRPGMDRLLALVESGDVQVVIIAKLDRLTRSVKDLGVLLERFQKQNVSLVSVAESLDTGSASGRLVLNLLCSVAQWERETIGERTATALQFKKSHRRVYNHTPYGYVRVGDQLGRHPDEQLVISRIKVYRANGWALRRIADFLNREGVPAKRGGKWFAQTVRDVLENTLNDAA